MPTNFLILSAPRTGSTLLGLWLNQHQQVSAHSEVFLQKTGAKDSFKHYVNQNHSRYFYNVFCNKISGSLPFNFVNSKLTDKFLDSLYHNPNHSGPWTSVENWEEYHPKKSNISCCGFKIMYRNLFYNNRLNQLLFNDSFLVIHLIRKDLISRTLSLVRLKKTKQAHVSETKNISELTYPVNSQYFFWLIRHYINQVSRWRKKLDSLKQVIEISYEDMVENDTQVLKNLCDFLKVDDIPLPLPTKLKKIANDPWIEIANKEQLITKIKQDNELQLLARNQGLFLNPQ